MHHVLDWQVRGLNPANYSLLELKNKFRKRELINRKNLHTHRGGLKTIINRKTQKCRRSENEGDDGIDSKDFKHEKETRECEFCIGLVRMKWAPTRQRLFMKTNGYIWRWNKDYVGGSTC